MNQNKFNSAMMALKRVERIGNARLFNLSSKVVNIMEEGSIDPESLSVLANEDSIVPRCSPDDISKWMEEAGSNIEEWAKDGIGLITPNSQDYPDSLKAINQAPFFLYYKGEITPLGRKNAAIVGTRKPSDEGGRQARNIGRKLASIGIGVVSGLALGCDTAGHEGALDGGGYTCAVLAHGLDMVSPASNRDLASRILDSGGSLVSEHAPGTKPLGRYFAMRNRIQSGLSNHVIVIETSMTGGTMHTARFASEQGKSIGVLEFHEGMSNPDFAMAIEAIEKQLSGEKLSSLSQIERFVTSAPEEE
jgi:DNA processing protein